MPADLTAIDLFAGAGGATEGLKQATFKVLGAIENDTAAADTYQLNHPETRLVRDDVRRVDAHEFRRGLELEVGDLTLLKACPPCQSYSTLGSGKADDERNDLVHEVWHFAREFKPQYVVLENVPGLARDWRFELLIRRLRAVAYRVKTYLVDATEFGVPQHRKRLIVLAALSPRRPPSSISDNPMRQDSVPTVGDVFAKVIEDKRTDPINVHRRHRPEVLERIKAIPSGGGRFDLPAEHRLACHERLQGRRACASYGRMRADQPAPTLTTRCTTPACGRFIHPWEDRGLTLREAALLQTFPAAYRFLGRYGQIEAQIGNALPVRMAQGIGLLVKRALRS